MDTINQGINRGDIYYADLNPIVGCEQGGVRPVLILQNDIGNQHSPTFGLVASPASPQSAGTSVTLTATLTGYFTGPDVNGETITFKNGTTTLGTATPNSGGVAAYTWTPGSAENYSLTAEYAGNDYNTAATSNAVSFTVSAPLPTAAAYAADADSDTDYVLDDTNKILFINTDKGAAFWSASGASYLGYTIRLAVNIDVSAFLWTPVGDNSNPYPFTGSFDGQENSITGLTVDASTDVYAGLFGYAYSSDGATIKNRRRQGAV